MRYVFSHIAEDSKIIISYYATLEKLCGAKNTKKSNRVGINDRILTMVRVLLSFHYFISVAYAFITEFITEITVSEFLLADIPIHHHHLSFAESNDSTMVHIPSK